MSRCDTYSIVESNCPCLLNLRSTAGNILALNLEGATVRETPSGAIHIQTRNGGAIASADSSFTITDIEEKICACSSTGSVYPNTAVLSGADVWSAPTNAVSVSYYVQTVADSGDAPTIQVNNTTRDLFQGESGEFGGTFNVLETPIIITTKVGDLVYINYETQQSLTAVTRQFVWLDTSGTDVASDSPTDVIFNNKKYTWNDQTLIDAAQPNTSYVYDSTTGTYSAEIPSSDAPVANIPLLPEGCGLLVPTGQLAPVNETTDGDILCDGQVIGTFDITSATMAATYPQYNAGGFVSVNCEDALLTLTLSEGITYPILSFEMEDFDGVSGGQDKVTVSAPNCTINVTNISGDMSVENNGTDSVVITTTDTANSNYNDTTVEIRGTLTTMTWFYENPNNGFIKIKPCLNFSADT